MATGWPMKTTYANGDVFSSSDVNDITGTINLLGASVAYAAAKNAIINGAMVIDQRNNGASVTPNVSYTLDRWQIVNTQASKLTVQRNAGSVTPPSGFAYYLGVTSSSAYSVNSTDTFYICQYIEGNNAAQFGFGTASAKTVTLSFYVYSSLTGTFGGSLANSAGNRSYPFSYTISAANTWERKTITIAGDTTGTWLTDTGIGIQVRIGLGSGSTYTATAGSWAAGNYVQSTSNVSVVGTNAAKFYLTGVQLEQGSTATAFQTATGTIQGELLACMRYYYNLVRGNGNYIPFSNGYQFTSTQVTGITPFPVTMRTAPTLDMSGGTDYYLFSRNGANDFWNTCISDGSSTTTGAITVTSNISGTAGQGGAFYSATANTGSGYIAWSAEL